jgi:hypothetical protein
VEIVGAAAIRWRIHDGIECVSISRKHETMAMFPRSRAPDRVLGADADRAHVICDQSISRTQANAVDYDSHKWLHLDRFVFIRPAGSILSIIVYRSKDWSSGIAPQNELIRMCDF